MSVACQSAIPTPTLSPLGDPVITRGYFAFARIQGNVCLVQVSLDTPASALTAVDVNIFRHEFITIFRLSETKTIHPSDISILETIDEFHTRYEEESGTVFLARELMRRLQQFSHQPQHLPRHKSRFGTQLPRRR